MAKKCTHKWVISTIQGKFPIKGMKWYTCQKCKSKELRGK
jgi:hypothetical protein